MYSSRMYAAYTNLCVMYVHTLTSMVLCNTHENDGGPESPGAIKLDTKKKNPKRHRGLDTLLDLLPDETNIALWILAI